MSSDTKKTFYSWLGVLFNFIIACSLMIPVFSLNISSYHLGIKISLSPLALIGLATGVYNWTDVIGSDAAMILFFICVTMFMLSIAATTFFLISLKCIFKRSKVYALKHSKLSIITLLILNAICVGIVIVWNTIADSASKSSSDFLTSAVIDLVKMQFPDSAVIFIFLLIAGIIAINRFIRMSYMADKCEQQKHMTM